MSNSSGTIVKLSMPQLLSYLGCAVVAWLLADAVYQVYFSPLRNIPGPLVRRFSILPYVWSIMNGTEIACANELHKKYGPVVRESPGDVFFVSEQAYKDIYLRPGQPELSRSRFHYLGDPMQRAEPPKNVLVSDGAIHSRMRKTLTQCFSTQTLKDSESTIIHYADLLIAKLHEESKTGPCDLAAYYNFATFDILADLAFGHPFGVLARGQYNTFMSRLFSNLWVVSILVGISLTPGLSSTFAFLVRNLNIGHQARTKFKQTVKDVVMKRQAEDTDRKDFLGHMMAFTGEKGLSQIELESNAEILIVAGSETSATALAGITFHLLQDRQCLERLQQEVRARFKSSAEIGPSTALQLPYLKAVFEESMRIYPSAPGGMPRTLQGDTIIDGVVISAGTNVSVANYVSNHSEMNYKDPDKFVPQRWLGLEGYEEDKLTTFHPFSLGPKNCIGRSLAYHEVSTILAKMMYHFDMEPGMENTGDWIKQKCFVVWKKSPLMVKLVAREVV